MMQYAEVVPIRATLAPSTVSALSNWTKRESFAQLSASARPRIHSRYGRPASA